ncbi:uncharacterized protein C8Q71DRAFT_770186 [Rhodofomes roseus]|uniref:Uncharacterized protein n=1 Tax=Rhodofomes roseus TaxID=34475 RepID=A0ABQ8KC75_9APHY|nr:uncharacterized protein C8Q71DRAFT_770186 [Rhodofomes roseus]KAH9834655.1 hypothetical protein C8Q71DRAFT_770186 [Rhodofomes roseus]
MPLVGIQLTIGSFMEHSFAFRGSPDQPFMLSPRSSLTDDRCDSPAPVQALIEPHSAHASIEARHPRSPQASTLCGPGTSPDEYSAVSCTTVTFRPSATRCNLAITHGRGSRMRCSMSCLKSGIFSSPSCRRIRDSASLLVSLDTFSCEALSLYFRRTSLSRSPLSHKRTAFPPPSPFSVLVSAPPSSIQPKIDSLAFEDASLDDLRQSKSPQLVTGDCHEAQLSNICPRRVLADSNIFLAAPISPPSSIFDKRRD